MSGRECQLGDDDKLAEFECCGDDFLAECGRVVFVRMPDLLDEAVRSESLEQARDLTTVELGQMTAQRFILKSADVELAANHGAQQIFIIRVEQVEAGVTPTLQFDRLR